MKPELFSHQKRVISSTLELVKQEKTPILIVASTGAGKTFIGCKLIHHWVRTEQRCLFIAPNDPLVVQTVKTAFTFGLKSGVIKAGYQENRSELLQIAGFDTLVNRELPAANLVIIDEAHLSYAPSWRPIIKHYLKQNAVIIGLTATPYRTVKTEDLKHIYKHWVKAAPIRELIADEKLSDAIYYTNKYPLPNSKMLANPQELEKYLSVFRDLYQTPDGCNEIVEEWMRHCYDLQTIGFTRKVEHSRMLARKFRSQGINATTIDITIPNHERGIIIQKFRDRTPDSPQIIFSIAALELGFDVPTVGCIIQAHSTKSQKKNTQQIGRGLRTSPNKSHCKILDMVGNIWRFGAINQIDKVPNFKRCSLIGGGCGALIANHSRSCPHCGWSSSLMINT